MILWLFSNEINYSTVRGLGCSMSLPLFDHRSSSDKWQSAILKRFQFREVSYKLGWIQTGDTRCWRVWAFYPLLNHRHASCRSPVTRIAIGNDLLVLIYTSRNSTKHLLSINFINLGLNTGLLPIPLSDNDSERANRAPAETIVRQWWGGLCWIEFHPRVVKSKFATDYFILNI